METTAARRRCHVLNPEAYFWVHATLIRGAVDAKAFIRAGEEEPEGVLVRGGE